jgi:hypothetical protein
MYVSTYKLMTMIAVLLQVLFNTITIPAHLSLRTRKHNVYKFL